MGTSRQPYNESFLKENALEQPIHCHMEHKPSNQRIVGPHFHNRIELLFSFAGITEIFVGEKTLLMSEGDLVIINSNEVHSIFAKEGKEVHYLVIKLDPEVLYSTSRSIFESKYVLPFTMAKSSPQSHLSKKNVEQTKISFIIEKILNEFENKNYGYELATRIHICEIFLEVLRLWERNNIFVHDMDLYEPRDIELLKKMFSLLEEHYSQSITAQQIAEACNLSYSYFSRKIKHLTDRSFTEILNDIRVKEAEKLLTTTDLTITEISGKVGYSSTSYFIQQFKSFKNISPYRFKKRLIEDSEVD